MQDVDGGFVRRRWLKSIGYLSRNSVALGGYRNFELGKFFRLFSASMCLTWVCL